ncbi:hypothetical protein, partial [uncultured Porphyromonas sp.]|uniref:hypothetical protein n=1 Tax=uncultured Porphyromonas sp. TaxID=159274 RepID=UPI00258BCD09
SLSTFASNVREWHFVQHSRHGRPFKYVTPDPLEAAIPPIQLKSERKRRQKGKVPHPMENLTPILFPIGWISS